MVLICCIKLVQRNELYLEEVYFLMRFVKSGCDFSRFYCEHGHVVALIMEDFLEDLEQY